jgi:CBS domain-containing protein
VQVREIMTSPAVSLPPTASIAEAAAVMVQHRIGSVVAVDGDPPRVAGMFTETELELDETLIPFSLPAKRAPRLLDLWAQSPEQLDEALAHIARRTIGEVMAAPAATVAAGAQVWEAMNRMAELGITRLAVLDGNRLVGVVARHDLLKAVARAGRTAAEDEDG